MAGTPRRIAGWIQITVRGTQESSQRANSFSYRWNGSSSAPSLLQLTQMAQAWYTACGTLYKAMCTATYNLDYVEARWLDPAGPLIAGVFVPTPPNPGTQSGLSTPANAAAVMSWRTGALGRRFRGRNYLPAISESQQVGSTVTAGYITNATALANAIFAFNNGGGSVAVQQVVASFVGQVLTPVLTVVIDSAIDSMRKRLIGRGR